jgi:hypothetical protein
MLLDSNIEFKSEPSALLLLGNGAGCVRAREDIHD